MHGRIFLLLVVRLGLYRILHHLEAGNFLMAVKMSRGHRDFSLGFSGRGLGLFLHCVWGHEENLWALVYGDYGWEYYP